MVGIQNECLCRIRMQRQLEIAPEGLRLCINCHKDKQVCEDIVLARVYDFKRPRLIGRNHTACQLPAVAEFDCVHTFGLVAAAGR